MCERPRERRRWASRRIVGSDECEAWCLAQTGIGANNYTIEPCSSNQASGSCAGWNPNGSITLNAGVRYVGSTFFNNLVANPAPLWTCDDAHLEKLGGGNYQVVDANNGELLYALGLRNGDIPQALNGKGLASHQYVVDAFIDLYVDEGEDSFALLITRNSQPLVLYYQVI